MADAEAPLQVGAAVDHIRQVLQPALGLFHLQAAALGPDGHAGGVVPPVLHPLQSVQQNRGRLFAAHKANDSAHSLKCSS